MKHSYPSNTPALQEATFLALLVGVTLAFGWILLPFYGAVFWGVVLSIVFAPLYRRLMQAAGAASQRAARSSPSRSSSC